MTTDRATMDRASASMDPTRMAMMLFIASEAVFFVLLIIAYVTYHRQGGNGPTAANSLDPVKTGVYSIFLLTSSATVWRAGVAQRAGARARTLFWLAVTIVFGAVFLVGQGIEYAHLIHRDVTVSRDLFGTTFFTLTGFHGLHVFVGLVLLGTMLGLTASGRFDGRDASALETASLYWHFVDVVWIFIFGVVYLWAFL